MTNAIAVAGANGNLGGRIVAGLLDRGATVIAIVRASSDTAKLSRPGVTIAKLPAWTAAEVAKAATGAACVVSAMQGLRDVIVDAQTVLLEGAVAAGVPRFIPSDYSIDFMKTPPGGNRNLDLRREFNGRLARAAIAPTSVLNGAFAELLLGRMPLLDFAAKKVSFWGEADQKMDFTTMDNTAAFTAAAALDAAAPKTLRIAGDQVSARELAALATELVGSPFELVRAGSVDELSAIIERTRGADPASEQQPYPRWQGMQYMRDMFSGRAKLDPIDNARYPGIRWTTARELLAARPA